MTTANRLLVDGDEFLFKACAAVEVDIRWDEDNHVLMSSESEAWETFVGMIDGLIQRFPLAEPTLCFTDKSKPNFRYAIIDPSYKSNRKGARKPLCYMAVKQRATEHYKTQSFPGLEADDVIGILATQPVTSAIIVSQDKDMKTIPATLFDGKEIQTIPLWQADYWHLYQTLVGDNADGYKGCPGIGPVKAERILKDTAKYIAENGGTMWGGVTWAYKKAGLTEADALQQARLARILRWDEWDRTKKEPILWTP